MPLFPKKPFYEQHEILASLSNSSLTIDNLHIFIEYPKTIPGIIKGYIIGENAEAERISALIHSREIYHSLNFY